MDPNVRRAALRAAAKTAIALSLSGATLFAGCSSSHGPSTMTPEPDAASVVAEEDAAVMAEPDAAVVMPDAATTPACEEHLASLAISTDSEAWPPSRFTSDEDRNDPRTGACCLELHTRAETSGTADIDPAIGMACCDVVVFAQELAPVSNLGCTPWGPPCPPEAPV